MLAVSQNSIEVWTNWLIRNFPYSSGLSHRHSFIYWHLHSVTFPFPLHSIQYQSFYYQLKNLSYGSVYAPVHCGSSVWLFSLSIFPVNVFLPFCVLYGLALHLKIMGRASISLHYSLLLLDRLSSWTHKCDTYSKKSHTFKVSTFLSCLFSSHTTAISTHIPSKLSPNFSSSYGSLRTSFFLFRICIIK